MPARFDSHSPSFSAPSRPRPLSKAERDQIRKAECRRERGTQFAPDAVGALDRLWALGALTTADVGVVASD